MTGFRACVPYVPDSAGDPSASLRQAASGSCDASPQGCFPSLSGGCVKGTAGDLPVAGPTTYYFALGSPSYCCLAGNVPVLMWDGTTKRADQIKNGDKIYGIDDKGTPTEQTVSQVTESTQPCIEFEVDDATLRCSADHLLMLESGHWVFASKINIEHMRFKDKEGKPKKLKKAKWVGSHKVYTWSASPNENFVAMDLVQATIPAKSIDLPDDGPK